jgi:hypothetical protein
VRALRRSLVLDRFAQKRILQKLFQKQRRKTSLPRPFARSATDALADLTTLEQANIRAAAVTVESAALPISHAAGRPRHGKTPSAEDSVSQKSAIAEIVARALRSVVMVPPRRKNDRLCDDESGSHILPVRGWHVVRLAEQACERDSELKAGGACSRLEVRTTPGR